MLLVLVEQTPRTHIVMLYVMKKCKKEVSFRAIQGRAGIKVGIEKGMMDGETVTENGVTVGLIGRNGIVKRNDMLHSMSIKSQKSKELTRRTFARKTCLHAFSIR